MNEIMDKVFLLKLTCWKGGYLSGIGRKTEARELRPEIKRLVREIEGLAGRNADRIEAIEDAIENLKNHPPVGWTPRRTYDHLKAILEG